MADNRVFVFGSGRSGTTLLAKLIDSSPDVLYLHEPDKLRPNEQIPYLPEPDIYVDYLNAAAGYVDQIYQERLPFVLGKRPLFPKSYRTPLQQGLFTSALAVLGLAEKVRLPIGVPDAVAGRPDTVLLKSVTSICRVPLFSRAHRATRFVHIVRHPGAVAASVARGVKQGVMPKGDYVDTVSKLSNAQRLPVDLENLREAGPVERSAYVWMVQNDKTFGEMQGSDNYLVVSYEDLCVNMQERLAEICEFIGIDLDSQMTRFVDAMDGADDNAGYFSVMRNPKSQISKWETEIGEDATNAVSELIANSEVGRLVLERYQAAKASLSG